MKYLLDTNVLLRLIELTNAQHKEAREAIKTLRRRNCVFYVLLQNNLGVLERLHAPER